ncbi:hypothetical protein CWM41_28765, partial [Escherichia coli]
RYGGGGNFLGENLFLYLGGWGDSPKKNPHTANGVCGRVGQQNNYGGGWWGGDCSGGKQGK